MNEKADIKRDIYIYHGTGKGQAMNIQNDGYMKPNRTGEDILGLPFIHCRCLVGN